MFITFIWLDLLRTFYVNYSIFQGVSSPTMLCAWSNWAPPLQRSIFISVALSGSSFGTFVTLPLAGLIADRLGWEAVFYFTGKPMLLLEIKINLFVVNKQQKAI